MFLFKVQDFRLSAIHHITSSATSKVILPLFTKVSGWFDIFVAATEDEPLAKEGLSVESKIETTSQALLHHHYTSSVI